jgi:hypothetical protein
MRGGNHRPGLAGALTTAILAFGALHFGFAIFATLTISPFAVVVAMFFSAALGLPGAFIGVPMLIAFLVYCRQNESTRWLAVLAAGGPPDADRAPDA